MEILILIAIVIAILAWLNSRGKNKWKDNIKSSLLLLPMQDMLSNILTMAVRKNHNMPYITQDNLCMSVIETVLMYIVINSKGNQGLNSTFRDIRNICTIICNDKVLILMLYASYGKICDAALEVGIEGDFDKLPIDEFVARLSQFQLGLNNITSEQYFGTN